MDPLDSTLGWIASASPQAVQEYLKALISRLSLNQTKLVYEIAGQKLDNCGDIESTTQLASTSVATKDPVVAWNPNKELFFTYAQNPEIILERWWFAFNKTAFVALDVECVNLVNVGGKEKEKAATVSVVDTKGNIIYHTKIFREPYSFATNDVASQISGITSPFDLVDGKKEDIVASDLHGLFQQRVCIAVGAEKDFRSLGLQHFNYKVFDLQSFYRRPGPFVCNSQCMSLRDIYFYHFGEDMQPSNKYHDATIDAKATMRIFLEGYCKIMQPREISFAGVVNLKSKEKKERLRFCKTANDFVDIGCTCDTCQI